MLPEIPSCTSPVLIDIAPLSALLALPVDNNTCPLDSVEAADSTLTSPLFKEELEPLCS